MKKSILLTSLLIGSTSQSWSQVYNVATIAGASTGNLDKSVTSLLLYSPEAVGFDGAGNLYVCDSGGHRVYKVDMNTGLAKVLIGTSAPGSAADGAVAATNQIGVPSGLVVNAKGEVFIADRNQNRIWKIELDGKARYFAGQNIPLGSGSNAGDGYVSSIASGVGNPRGMAFDAAGNLYVAETSQHRIRKITPAGIMSTIAGLPTPGAGFAGDGGKAIFARLSGPEDVAVDSSGNVFIADTQNHRIRKIDTNGIITTIAGLTKNTTTLVVNPDGQTVLVTATTTASNNGDGGPSVNAQMNNPAGLKFNSSGDLVIADRGNNVLRAIDTSGNIRLLRAGFNSPSRFAIGPDGPYFMAESGISHAIRVFDPAVNSLNVFTGIPHFYGNGTLALGAVMNLPTGIALDSKGNSYVADTYNHRIRRISTDGMIDTVVGSGAAGQTADGTDAAVSRLSLPRGLNFDPNGNLLIADSGNNRIALWNPTDNTVTTVAGTRSGNATSGFVSGSTGDGLPATAARLNGPWGVAADKAGNIYITDTQNNTIRFVDASDGTIRTIAGTAGVFGSEGDTYSAANALFYAPTGIAVDAAGLNIYVADTLNHVVRRITGRSGIVSTIAGVYAQASEDGGVATFTATGTPASNTMGYALRMNQPYAVAIDTDGNVVIADTNNSRVRKVNLATGQMARIAGVNASGGGLAGATTVSAAGATACGATATCYGFPNGNNIAIQNGIANGPDGLANPAAPAANTPNLGVLSYPMGIAVDSKGVIYVVSSGSGQVRTLTLQ